MVYGPDTSRWPREDEFEEIDALLQSAFGRPDEAELVHQLRAEGAVAFELIKCWTDPRTGASRIGAYAAFSRMVAPMNWFCLAPVAVLPEWQNGALAPDDTMRGSFRFGSRLIRDICEDFAKGDTWHYRLLEKAGLIHGDEPPTIVVVGKPSFYTRAGFSRERAAKLTSPYPLEYTLIARPGADVPEHTLIYPAAFSGI